jgi:hypothetical protein
VQLDVFNGMDGFTLNGKFYPVIRGGDGTGDAPGGGGSTGSAAGSDDSGDDNSDDVEDVDGSDDADDKSKQKGSGSGKPAAISLTTDQLGKRLEKARKQTLEKAARDAGFENAEAMQTFLKSQKEKADKEAGELTTTKRQLTSAESRAEKAEKNLRSMALQHAVEREAGSMGFYDPEDAYALGGFASDDVDDLIDEDGKVDKAQITARLKELAEKKKHLVKSADDDDDGGPRVRDNRIRTGVGAPNPPRSGASNGASGNGAAGGGKKETREEALKRRMPFAYSPTIGGARRGL